MQDCVDLILGLGHCCEKYLDKGFTDESSFGCDRVGSKM
jgi:hypothetical protein